MASRTTSAALLALSLAACGPSAMQPGLPPAMASSWVIATLTRSEPVRLLDVQAMEADSALRFVASTFPLRVMALGYDATLAELGLGAGAVAAGADCERSCGLDAPSAIFRLDLDGPQDVSWIAAEAIDPGLRRHLVRDAATRCETRCLTVTASAATLPGHIGKSAFFLAAEPEDAAATSYRSGFLGLPDGAIYRIGRPGVAEELCAAAAFRPRIGAWEVEGRRLIALSSRRVLATLDLTQLRPGEPCPYTVTATLGIGTYFIDVVPVQGAPGDLWTLSSTGAVERWDGALLQPIGRAALDGVERATEYGFLIERDGTLFASAAGDDILTLRGGQVGHQRGFALGPKATAAEAVLARGEELFVTMKSYNLFHLDGGAFVPLDEGRSRMDATWEDCHALRSLRGRHVCSLNHGLFGQWHPRTHYCPLVGPFSFDSGVRALIVAGNYVYVDGDFSQMPLRVVWLTPDAEPVCEK